MSDATNPVTSPLGGDDLAKALRDAYGQGWVLVPQEPTEEMVQAGWIDKEDVDPDDIYCAMIAAAPPPPKRDEGAGARAGAWLPAEPTEAMERAFEAAYWAKSGDISSPTPTEHPEDGGGPFGYGYRAMIAQYIARLPAAEPIAAASEPRGGRDETASQWELLRHLAEAVDILGDSEAAEPGTGTHEFVQNMRRVLDERSQALAQIDINAASVTSPERDRGELEGLSEKATDGPWEMVRSPTDKPSEGWRIYGADGCYRVAQIPDISEDPMNEANAALVVALVNAYRSGKLVASTGLEEETKGACLTAPGSCPTGPTASRSSGFAAAIPSRKGEEHGHTGDYEPQLIYYEGDDRLEFISHDVATITRHLGDGCAVLLSMETREPVGFYIERAKAVIPGMLAASCDEHQQGEDPQGAESRSDASAVAEGQTPEATPKSSPDQTPVDPQMTVEEAREVLDAIGARTNPQTHASILRGHAIAMPVGPERDALVSKSARIEAALRTLQAGGEVR